MVPNVWIWLKLLCTQAENCQHYSWPIFDPSPLKCRRLKWMVPNVWTWLKLLCAQAENCQHYSEWGGYSSQEIGLTWLDLSGINEACLIDKEERGSLEGCKQKTFSTMDLYPIWRSILTIMHLQGVPTQTFIFHFALVGGNMQASFGLKVIWEFWIADFLLMTLGFGQK